MNRRQFVAALGLLALVATSAACVQQDPPARAPDVPYEPSPPVVVRAMLELAGVGPSDVVYDLGSGDGRIPITAAREFGARAVGIDIDPVRIAESNANAANAGVTGKVRFIAGDLFTSDFREATVVTLFLWPHINMKLRPQLLKLKPGTRIVSHMHDLGDWAPDKTVRVRVEGENRERTLLLWVVRQQ